MSNTSGNLLSFLVGVAAGSAAGVLFAPDSGQNTRDKLKYQLPRYRDKIKQLIKDLQDGENLPINEAKNQSQKVIKEAQGKAEKLLHDIDHLIDEIKDNKTSRNQSTNQNKKSAQ